MVRVVVRGEDRILLIDPGPDLHVHVAPERLSAPPDRTEWEILLVDRGPSRRLRRDLPGLGPEPATDND